MSQFFVYPPSFSTNPSVGTIGSPIPAQADLAGAEDGSGDLQPLLVDGSGSLKVSITSLTPSSLPIDLIKVGGSAIALGQSAMAASLPVVIASNQSTIPISAASLPLPAGAATSVLQTTGNSSLASIDTSTSSIDSKTPALGQALAAASVPVVLTAAQLTTLTPLSTIAATQSGVWSTRTQDGSGTAISSTGGALDVNIASATSIVVSGTVSATQGTSPWVENLSQVGGASFALGQQLAAASLPVVLTASQLSTLTPLSTVAATQSGTWNINNISGTISLPTGASTSANQVTANTSLSSIDSKTPALGQALAAASVPVVLTAAQISTLTPLSTVAVTQSTSPWVENLSQVGGASFALGQQLAAASLPIVLTASQLSTLTPLSSVTVTQATGSNLHVVVDSGSITPTQPSGRAKANTPVVTDYSSSPVTSAAYVQLIASTSSTANMIEIFDSSGVALYLAVGAAASEVNQFIIYPGGNGQVPLAIPSGSRISVKAVSTSATSGTGIINLYT